MEGQGIEEDGGACLSMSGVIVSGDGMGWYLSGIEKRGKEEDGEWSVKDVWRVRVGGKRLCFFLYEMDLCHLFDGEKQKLSVECRAFV